MGPMKFLTTKPGTVAHMEMRKADRVWHIGVPLVGENLWPFRFLQGVVVGDGRHPPGPRGAGGLDQPVVVADRDRKVCATAQPDRQAVLESQRQWGA